MDILSQSTKTKKRRRATASHAALTINRREKLVTSRVLVVGSFVSIEDNEDWLVNHLFSNACRTSSSLSIAICLDISWTNGEPFGKTYNVFINYTHAYKNTNTCMYIDSNTQKQTYIPRYTQPPFGIFLPKQ